MFSCYRRQATSLLKCGLNTLISNKLNVKSRHTIVYRVRPVMSKIKRQNYGDRFSSKNLSTVEVADNNNSKFENNILEIMDSPDKIERDHKNYRVLKLKNGLTALLISDPILPETDEKNLLLGASNTNSTTGTTAVDYSNEKETDDEKLGACSVCVDVGSFSDPRDIQGLAHFLEHMVFMGSRKYPSENAFDQFIKRCAGFNNAETNFEETSYYLEVSEKCLDGALDRFSHLFKDPLMLKESMKREREAVDSEFRSKMQGDGVRREQLLASFGNPEHPCSVFSWGNLKTLRDNLTDDELYHRVHEFRNLHYSAHRMYVCMQARYPIDEMQELLIKYFSDIPSNEFVGNDFSKWNHLNAFQDQFTEKIFVVKPVSNVIKLDLTFCLESLAGEYKTKSHHFISYLLGYEGKGSLTSYLRKKNYALELITGVDESGFGTNEFYSLFTITCFLTNNGLNHIKEQRLIHIYTNRQILEAIFGYLKYLEDVDPVNHTKVLYTELQTMEANNYRFQRERSPLENVENLVINLKYFPPKDLLSGPNLFFEYDYNSIQSLIEKINRTKMNIILTTKTPYEGRKFDQVEQWFGTQYCSFDFPKDWLELWENPKHFDEFALPEKNVYIPTDLTILYDPSTTKVPAHPEKIMENGVCELWFRQDDRFFLPIAYYHFYFQSPMARGSIENVVLLSLYALLLKYKLVELLYPATVAGLGYMTYPSEKGLFLKVSGYSQNLHLLVKAFIENLTTFADEVTEQEFNMFVEQQLKNYSNTLISPKALAKSIRLSIIDDKFYPTYDKCETMKKLTLSDFKSFAGKFLQQLDIQALFQGNITRDSAVTLMDNILTQLKPQPIKDFSSLKLVAHKLPVGAHFLRCASMNADDVNTLTCNFYQIGSITLKTINMIDLLMMVAEEPLFDTLRSKEQLGYDVSCGLRDNYGILGFSIMVNSQENKFSAEFVEERIEAFRMELLNIIRRISDSEFEQYKESLAKIKLTDDNSMKEEVCRHWAEIITREYAFDRSKRDVECLQKLTKADFLQFFEKHFHESRKLSIQVIGSSQASCTKRKSSEPDVLGRPFEMKIIPMSKPSKGYCIQSIPDFVKTLELYPVTKTKFKCED